MCDKCSQFIISMAGHQLLGCHFPLFCKEVEHFVQAEQTGTSYLVQLNTARLQQMAVTQNLPGLSGDSVSSALMLVCGTRRIIGIQDLSLSLQVVPHKVASELQGGRPSKFLIPRFTSSLAVWLSAKQAHPI